MMCDDSEQNTDRIHEEEDEEEDPENPNNENNEPHAYIHVPPTKTGDKYQRFIVPVSKIKKFDYNTYIENTNTYKDKVVKYKNKEGNKIKCFVLFAAEDFHSVQVQVDQGKRFRIPTVRQSDTSNTSHSQQTISEEDFYFGNNNDNNDLQNDHQENIKRAKLERKQIKNLKLQTAQKTSNEILQKYINTIANNDSLNKFNTDESPPREENVENVYRTPSLRTSVSRNPGFRPLRPFNETNVAIQEVRQHDHSECSKAIDAFKLQVTYFREKYQTAQNEAQQWKRKYESIAKQNPEISCPSDSSLLEYYDKLFKYDGPLQRNEQSDCVKLLHDVQCKTIAYKAAFKSAKPIQVVRHLMVSIYGYEDLAKCCQKRESASHDRIPICKKKSEAIERELYRFLRLNNYNIQLIKLELQEIDKYYHNAISCARLKRKRQKSVEETMEQLEQEVAVAGNLFNDPANI